MGGGETRTRARVPFVAHRVAEHEVRSETKHEVSRKWRVAASEGLVVDMIQVKSKLKKKTFRTWQGPSQARRGRPGREKAQL